MPLYDYECLSCGHVYELRQGFAADPEGICPRCAGKSKRKFHPVPIIYKGSGFYTTDYKHASLKETSKDKKEEEGTKKKAKAGKATDASSEDKTEGKKEATKEA